MEYRLYLNKVPGNFQIFGADGHATPCAGAVRARPVPRHLDQQRPRVAQAHERHHQLVRVNAQPLAAGGGQVPGFKGSGVRGFRGSGVQGLMGSGFRA